MRSPRAAAASLAALTLVAATVAPPAAAARDWGPLADLVASVLVVREGGVDAALDALPHLHDATHVSEKRGGVLLLWCLFYFFESF